MLFSKGMLLSATWLLAIVSVSCTHPGAAKSSAEPEGISVPTWDSGVVPPLAEAPAPAPTDATVTKPEAKPVAAEAAPQSREDQIWAAVNDRVGTQIEIWFDEGEFPKVIQLLEFQERMLPSSYDIATNLGWMYENVEDYDSATGVYYRYRDDNPKEPDNVLAAGEYFFRRKQYAKVIEIEAPVIGRKGMHPNNYRILANAYERLHKYKESEAILMKYLAIAPDDGQSKKNLERVRKKMNAKPGSEPPKAK